MVIGFSKETALSLLCVMYVRAELIPRPARASDDPPLYLRLRMGKPAGRPLPRTTPLMSYGRKRMKPEYWFGVPRNR